MFFVIEEAENFDLYQLLNTSIEKYSEKNAIHFIYN